MSNAAWVAVRLRACQGAYRKWVYVVYPKGVVTEGIVLWRHLGANRGDTAPKASLKCS